MRAALLQPDFLNHPIPRPKMELTGAYPRANSFRMNAYRKKGGERTPLLTLLVSRTSHPASPEAHPSAHSIAENDPSSYAPCGGLLIPTLHAAGMLRFHPTCGADRIVGIRLLFASGALARGAPLPETARVLHERALTQRSSGRSSAALRDLQRSLGANFSWLPSLASSLPSRRGLYSNHPNWQAELPDLYGSSL